MQVCRLLLVMGLVAVGFAGMIGCGYLLFGNEKTTPSQEIVFGTVASLVLAVGCLAIVIRIFKLPLRYPNIYFAPSRRRLREIQEKANAERAERIGQRVAELSADPAKWKYIPLVEKGEIWSDEQIKYSEDTTLTATCVHVQPIERAMRQAGVEMRLRNFPMRVWADCWISSVELSRIFPVKPPVYYTETDDRDGLSAYIICMECNAAIDVVHPLDRNGQRPWFPSPP